MLRLCEKNIGDKRTADSLIEGKKLWIRQNRNVVERY